MNLLEMRSIKKAFNGIDVLNGVDLTVERGEVHALLGENGAGKSTLMNILTGVYFSDAGTVNFDGQNLTGLSIRDTEAAGIAFVHQELSLFNDLKAYENIYLGKELVNRFGTLQHRQMAAAAAELFARLGVDIDPYAEVSELKTSQKQLLEIAKALFFDAKLLIPDEPTTALNNEEVEHLFQIVRKLKEKGTAFILISHKMPEIFELCDSYTVLRNGSFVTSGKIADTTPARVSGLMVGSELRQGDVYVTRDLGDTVLSLKDFSGPGFTHINLELHRGEVVGFTGLQGCGSSELMQCMFGVTSPTSGTIEMNGKRLSGGSIHEAMRSGIAMLASNRKENSLLPDLSLLENMYVSEQVLSARYFKIRHAEEEQKFVNYRESLGIKCNNSEDLITALSGGNQQKVFVARWLNTDAQVLLFDNPTQGIDVGAKAEIYRLILTLAEQGKTIVINTLEIPEIRQVADACYVFYEGSIIKALSHQKIEEHTVMLYSTNSLAAEATGGNKTKWQEEH